MPDDSDLDVVQDYVPGVSDDDLAKSAEGPLGTSSEAVRDGERKHILSWRKNTGREGVPASVLTGLAISGGGIRSATFSLGILQALAKKDLLKHMDYLSTVSGGGYIGSSLTWYVGRHADRGFGVTEKDFPYGTDDPTGRGDRTASDEQKSLLKYLRQHGKYLTPGNGITLASLIAVVLRGTLLNLLVWIPIFLAAMMGLLFASGLPPGETFASGQVPRVFRWLLWGAMATAGLFVVASAAYSIWTRQARRPKAGRYRARRGFERVSGGGLWALVLLLVVGSVPYVEQMLNDQIQDAGGVAMILSGAASGLWAYFRSGKTEGGVVPLGLIVSVGAFLFIYGIVLVSYLGAIGTYTQADPLIWSIAGGFVGVALITGWFVNLNYISVHRFYRDRLMETFMPDVDQALTGQSGLAKGADGATIYVDPSQDEPRGPYHIVNTNVVLVDSANRKLKIRGGDNFILSPRYCGSNATGWCRTDLFMHNGMTLATAMAISGAAANPNTGVGGVGLTRNPLVSLLMALLNLRLGYWGPHPDPKKRARRRPNHFDSGWYEVLPNGYRENNAFLQLSDGGHFENLALYELIRRRLKLIIVCDGGADLDFNFEDLQTAIRRVRADFGALVDFDKDNHPKLLIPQDDLIAGYPRRVKLAKKGHIVGTVTYADGSKGTLVYLKTTLIDGMSLELLGYKSAHPDFPDETTADQFFDEDQFEAYRELGYRIASAMIDQAKLADVIQACETGTARD